MNGPPFYYDYINSKTSQVSPSTVHIHNTYIATFFKRYLLERAIAVFKWKIPETWNLDYLTYVIYCWGYAAVFKTDKFGVIPQGCGLSGYNVFYQPTRAIIANPLISRTLEPIIGQTCELLKLQPNYCGILDIVNYYGDMLALAAETLQTNIINSRLVYVFSASSKAGSEALKKVVDSAYSGNPAVFYDSKAINPDGKSWETYSNDLRSNFVAPEIVDLMRSLRNQFDTEVGIPNSNVDKKERLITSEVESNTVETHALADKWLESLQDGCKRVNKMFGIDIGVDWRFKEVDNIGSDNDTTGSNDLQSRDV